MLYIFSCDLTCWYNVAFIFVFMGMSVGFFLTPLKQGALERVVRRKGRANIQDVPENPEEDETFHSSVA